ncbi:DUF6701 domain-containing protein [Vibrio natriegens]|uniref:DUF6701 domain-containing protein n=1 Tax=Vibrio natriegens TaxID=691 RepID=UPI001FB9870F|nr:DUF6701 domain-containing protein [Vibrio natriegens]
MKKLFFYLTILLFSSSLFAANHCYFKGNRNFTIEVTVTGKRPPQEIYVTNKGGNKKDVLWYTGNASDDGLNYIFKEEQLINGSQYVVRIINDAANGNLKYYKKPIGGSWSGPEVYNGYIHQGNIYILSDIDSVNFSCQSGIKEPEVPSEPIDYCKYFPEPAQSWKPGASLNIENDKSKITGWSGEYINQYLFNGQLKTSYDKFSSHAGLPEACEVGGCTSGGPKVETPEPINTSFNSNIILNIDVWNYKSKCTLANNCKFSESEGTVYVDILGPLQSLRVEEYSSSDKHFVINFKPINNGSGPAIKNYTSGGTVDTVFHSGSYTMGSVSFNGGTLEVHSEVILNLVTSLTQSTPVEIIDVDGKKDLIIYGPSASLAFDMPNVDFAAQILADRVTFSNPITIRGAVTANTLTMSTPNINIIGEGACLTSSTEKSDYTLELSPRSDIALSCDTESIQPTLSVLSDGALATDFTGNIVVTIDGEPETYQVNHGSFSKELEISGGGASKTVSVDAYIEGDESTKVTGSYQFVPYNLKIDDQYVIANKSVKVSAIAQACNDDKQVVDFGYDGEPDVSSQWVRPASGAVGSLTYSPSFSSGKSSDDLTLEDSGEMLVTLTDDNFTCSGDDCPIEGGTLQGQFTVYSRPWTFAICSPRGSAMDGNITTKTSLGFAAAGESFDLEVRPLRWVSGGKDGNPVNTFDKQTDPIINYCNNSYAITENFFASNSPESEVMLSYSLAAPAEAEGGKKGSLSGWEATVNSDYTGETVLPFNGLKWSEVGVLRVNADAQYLGMDINQGYRDIGRFYPAYFEITQSDWSVDNQNDIAYLSQPYDLAEFAIVPYSLDGNAVENYSQFDLSLQAGISVMDDKDLGDRLTVSVSDGEWDNGSTYSRWYLEDQYAVFYRDFTLNTQGVRESSVDGPFNVSEDANSTTTNFGFTISTNSDPIDSRTQNDTTCLNSTEQYSSACDLSFPTQPPARYGRMGMDDVGGTSVSTINIPLRVEYWNGSRFITNTDDSASDYSSDEDYVCYQEVWSEASGSDGSLKAVTKTVDSGVSDELYATPYSADDSSSIRQQIRFWLRMDDTSTTSPQTLETDDVTCGSSYMSQPWLQYNWRGKGDEDPSSVVTFGIHRGNDRVIYRGEPGLTAQ